MHYLSRGMTTKTQNQRTFEYYLHNFTADQNRKGEESITDEPQNSYAVRELLIASYSREATKIGER